MKKGQHSTAPTATDPARAIATAAARDNLLRQFPKGLLASTLATILASPPPQVADPSTLRPVSDVSATIAGQVARRAAIADLLNSILRECPAASYDARWAIAARRCPEVFQS